MNGWTKISCIILLWSSIYILYTMCSTRNFVVTCCSYLNFWLYILIWAYTYHDLNQFGWQMHLLLRDLYFLSVVQLDWISFHFKFEYLVYAVLTCLWYFAAGRVFCTNSVMSTLKGQTIIGKNEMHPRMHAHTYGCTHMHACTHAHTHTVFTTKQIYSDSKMFLWVSCWWWWWFIVIIHVYFFSLLR